MVSLSRNFNTSTGGGVFFNDASMSDGDDTQQQQPILGADTSKNFTPLETVGVAVAALSLSVSLAVAALIFAIMWSGEKEEPCLPYFIILYTHTAFWFFSLVVDYHIKTKHHEVRVNGYLEFYQTTHKHCRIPFYVVSLWNATLLILSTVFQHSYQDIEGQCSSRGFLKPINCVCIVIAVETVILAAAFFTYIQKVLRFNRSRPPPDVQREEWMMSFIQDSYSAGEIGYREHGDQVQDLLEKQADLIRCLKDRNTKLSQRIMLLSERLKEGHP